MLKEFLLTTAAVLAATAPATAQSLADVARAEEARRKTVKGQVKVYTNETLRGVDGGEPPSAPAPPVLATTPAGDTAAKPVDPPETKPAASGAEAPKDEKFWRDSVAAARDALTRSQAFADALQSQVNGLYTEFVNASDPAQRAVIEQKRLGAIAEQDRLKTDIARQTKALADIQDEARRANVPAGWLR
jgi:hypothetical protein